MKMKGVLMGIVLFVAFGLPAHAQNFGEQQILSLQTWSTQCDVSTSCKEESAKLVSRIRSLAQRYAVYLNTRTRAEYDAIQNDGKAIVNDIDAWTKQHRIVPTKIVSERTN